jgi:hypothetical protein
MKATVYQFSAPETKVVPLDVNRPQFAMAVQAVVKGTATYSVYATSYNVFSYATPELAAADDIWMPIDQMSAATANQDYSIAEVTSALKIVVSSVDIPSASNVRIAITQQGLQ